MKGILGLLYFFPKVLQYNKCCSPENSLYLFSKKKNYPKKKKTVFEKVEKDVKLN